MFKNLIQKSEYTVQDLWIYFSLKFNTDTSWSPARIKKSEYEKRRQDYIDSLGSIPPSDEASLLDCVNFYGLEPVLVAIDIMADAWDGETVEIKNISRYINKAIVTLSRMELMNKVV